MLATSAEFRGRGHGARLLAVAESLARDTGKSGLSIIVSEANAGARSLLLTKSI